MTLPQAVVRARLGLATAARDSADHARTIVGNIGGTQTPADRIEAARRLRILAVAVLDHAVIMGVADGVDWPTLAEALGLSVSETSRRYADITNNWLNQPSPGLSLAVFGGHGVMHPDRDPEGLAASIEQWYARHQEPWETPSVGLGVLDNPT